MPNAVIERIHSWYSDVVAGEEIQEVAVLVQQLVDELYSKYEPTVGPNPHFWHRLDGWLNTNLTEAQQKLLFQLIPHIFFVGPDEFYSLYRSAFNGPIARWLIDEVAVTFADLKIEAKLKDAVASTWFCPITDSMHISSFYHVNHISGYQLRSDWQTLAEFKNEKQVTTFVKANRIERIVLLEDFVGSGSQVADALSFACHLPSKTPVLFVPLLICEGGSAMARGIESMFPQFRFDPVLSIRENQCLLETASLGEPTIFAQLRDVILDSFPFVIDGLSPHDLAKLSDGPFGFAKTGSLVVLHSNCPDNTLPLVHQLSKTWTPLFPRASRL